MIIQRQYLSLRRVAGCKHGLVFYGPALDRLWIVTSQKAFLRIKMTCILFNLPFLQRYAQALDLKNGL